MRFLKISALMLFSAITLLFLYANLRTVSPTARLEPVSLAIFELRGDLSDTPKALEEKLVNTNGVTACSVNYKGKVASVVYYTRQLTIPAIQNQITSEGGLTASLKTFETISGGCPVHALGNTFTKFISALDLR